MPGFYGAEVYTLGIDLSASPRSQAREIERFMRSAGIEPPLRTLIESVVQGRRP